MLVTMLIGVIITFLIFIGFLFFVNAYGRTALEPKTSTSETKTFNSLSFGEQKVEARVMFKDRPESGSNKVFGYIFWALMLAQFAIGIVIVIMAGVQVVPDGVCPEGMMPLVEMPPEWGPMPATCVTEGFKETFDACEEKAAAMEAPSYDDGWDQDWDDDWRRLGDGLERRLQVGKPLKHGRILMERGSDGKVVATIQHDMFSALYMTQFRSMTGRPLRRLQDASGDMWAAFEEYAQVPAVIFLCMLLAVPIWLAVLKTCTRMVVWGTLALNLIALLYAIIRPLVTPVPEGMPAPEPNITFIVLAVLYIALVAFMRKKILVAIDIIKIATQGLVETPSVFGASTVCFLMYGTYIAFWEISVISSTGIMVLTDTTADPDTYGDACQVSVPGYVNGMVRFLIVCFVPTTFFFFNACLCCCATGLGAWYFHADDPQKPRSPAFVGLKWAFFDSTGPVFVASLIQYAVYEIRKLILKRPNPCNPIWVIARVVWCFIESMVQAFTKMMLLGHIFHGGGVIATAKNSYAVLKSNLGQVLTTDMVSAQVVNWGLIFFSVGFGVASCAWMDQVLGEGLFVTGVDMARTVGIPFDLIVVFVFVLFLFFASYPLFSLVVMIGFVQGMVVSSTGNMLVGVFTGIFFAAISSIIFRFVGKIVHNCTDVIMYCLALEKETGKQQPERFENLYKVMKDQIPTGTTDAGAVAQGREVTVGGGSNWPAESMEAGGQPAEAAK
jgi:hypothetical protein